MPGVIVGDELGCHSAWVASLFEFLRHVNVTLRAYPYVIGLRFSSACGG